MLITKPIRDTAAATPRARSVRIDLQGSAFPYLAGQAVLIASHGQPRRPYSIAASPEESARDASLELLVGVDAEGRAGPHLSLEPGTLVDVEGPVGRFTFPPEPDERRFLFIAGGTGISPLRAMLRHLIASGSTAPISVVYSARVPEEFAFRTELERLARRRLIQLHLTVTGQTSAPWRGIRGRIALHVLEGALPSADAVCYLCGPPAMVEDVPPLLRQLGVPSSHVRTEEW